jgi:ribonucleoside-diphosphate reductase alpha chain
MVRTLRDAATEASIALARERGPFPAFDATRYLEPPGHASRLPQRLQDAIARHGLRNAHRLSLAPAGSISLAMAGGVSTGVEPVWGRHTQRHLRQPDGSLRAFVAIDPAWQRWARHHGTATPLPPAFETVADITPQAQLAMVAALAPLVDGAIAKTIHLPPRTTAADVATLLRRAWRLGVKGVTVYQPEAGLEAACSVTQDDVAAPYRTT